MSRIKLPGSKNSKLVLLSILVLIALVIIIKVGIDNRKNVNQEETINNEEIISGEEEKVSEIEEKPSINQEEDNLYNEAYSLFFQGNYKASIEKANGIIQKFPESYKAYNIRGIAKSFSVSLEEGIKDIDKSLQIKSDYGYARFNKALSYELYGDFEKSLAWYDKALEVEDYMWSYYGKASIYGRRADVENTILNLKKAIEVEGAKVGESGIKKEAKTETDFDPVRGNSKFQELISDAK